MTDTLIEEMAYIIERDAEFKMGEFNDDGEADVDVSNAKQLAATVLNVVVKKGIINKPSEILDNEVDYKEALRRIANGDDEPMEIAHMALHHGTPLKREAQASEMLGDKVLSRDEAERICRITITKNEDGTYMYSHSGLLPFDDVFACLKRQGWEPKRESVSLSRCAEAAKNFFDLTLVGPDVGFKPAEIAKAVLDAAGVKDAE